PTVTLTRNERGEWSFERMGQRPGSAPPHGGGGAPAEAPAPGAILVPSTLDVVVPRLALTRGTLLVSRETKGALVGARGIELIAALSRAGTALGGEGQLTVDALRVADRVEARGLTAPIKFGGGDLTLAPLRGTLADGTLGGQVTVRLASPPRYSVTLEL